MCINILKCNTLCSCNYFNFKIWISWLLPCRTKFVMLTDKEMNKIHFFTYTHTHTNLCFSSNRNNSFLYNNHIELYMANVVQFLNFKYIVKLFCKCVNECTCKKISLFCEVQDLIASSNWNCTYVICNIVYFEISLKEMLYFIFFERKKRKKKKPCKCI